MSSRREPFLHLALLWGYLCLLRMSSLHPIAILTVLVALAAFFFRDKLVLSNRALGAVSIGILLLTGFFNRTVETTGHYLGVGSISFAHLVAWLTLLALLMRRTENTRYLRHGLAAAMLVSSAMSTDLKAVVPLALIGLFLLPLAFREGQGLKVGRAQIVPLLSVLLVASLLGVAATASETRLGYLLRLFSVVPTSGVRFPPSSSLSALQRWHGSDVVVIRVYGKTPPRYLLGRTYDTYDQNSFWRWANTKEEIKASRTVAVETPSGVRELPLIFPKGEEVGTPGEPVQVEYPGGGSGYTIYAPRHFYGVASDLESLHRYSSGRLEERALDTFDGVYYLFPFQDGWNRPPVLGPEEVPPAQLAANLALPPNISPLVAETAHQVAGRLQDPEKKADFITGFLQNTFTYGYEYPFDPKGDALEQFLRDKPPAHCEFFATAAALMLRSQGVPTRYITGFVVQEQSLDGGYSVVRLKHAHAWIEAYLPEKGWTRYDPTPPGTLEEMDGQNDTFHAVIEWFSNQWRRFVSIFSLSPTELWARLVHMVKSLSWRHILVVLVLFGCWRGLRSAWRAFIESRNRRRRRTYQAGRHETLTPLWESLQDAVRPGRWQREPRETTGEWLQRLHTSDAPRELLVRLESFLRRYDAHRYGERIEPEQIASLREEALQLEEEFKGNSLQARERPDPTKAVHEEA